MSGPWMELVRMVDESSPITFAGQLKGQLLVVHGTGDDNVHYQVTEALVNALVLLQDKSVDVTDVRVTGGHAEAAIADLLQEEKSRGLTRAYRPVRR